MTAEPPVIAEYMRAWGRHAESSPLYSRLVQVVADDPELLRVINRIERRPPPNLLFAAVQYLLADGLDPDLAAYYASMVDEPLPPEEAGPAFRTFVLANEEEIVEIGNTRLTQTNECRRCVALLPGVMTAPFSSFHLVDLGTSAGLNLGLDHYHYRWNDLEWGPPSSVLLETESRGEEPVVHDIEVLSRVGLDLNPIDPRDEDSRLWLHALIWPEQVERHTRLAAALELVSGLDLEMVEGDALETLPAVLGGLPAGEPVVVTISFVLIQFTEAQRAQVDEIVGGARTSRPVHRVTMEVYERDDPGARLIVDDGNGPRQIGQAHPHGEWIELL